MALMEISVVPLGTSSTSLSKYVAEIIQILQREGIPHKLTDMGTIIEGDPETLFQVARRLHEVPFTKGALRVYTSIKIDDRRDKEVHLGDKVESVKGKTDV